MVILYYDLWLGKARVRWVPQPSTEELKVQREQTSVDLFRLPQIIQMLSSNALFLAMKPKSTNRRRNSNPSCRSLDLEALEAFTWCFSCSGRATSENERYKEVAAVIVRSQASNHVTRSRVPGTWTDAVDTGPKTKDELLKFRDQNVVVLSWFGGSGPPYNQALANIRLVGVMGAHFLAFLAREAGTRIEEMHVVGLSLGAHLASYIGSALKDMGQGKLGRITGLDPAGPLFEFTHPLVRLDPEDALFVDVIHSDAAPLAAGVRQVGSWLMLEHVRFPNNEPPKFAR
ncbi:unnamed protein product [Darwinula stevensoni]|uniref:Lipase domain-containing protein n=1 Tax=Darwinula stevensoni TaxID=69355 RepID=A0A7R8XK11_9CRUS|nr:unnamed protein product [Darwinula stevensoni]CAG0892720.1 unnamed protein product [Darwinula stevensoni]